MSGKTDRVAVRYARAIFESVAPDRFDDLVSVLSALTDAWHASSDLRAAITDPAVRAEQRLEAVRAITASFGLPVSKEVESFIDVLVSNGRMPVIGAVRDIVVDFVREYRKALSLSIVSATALSQDERQSMENELRTKLGSQVGVEWTVDPSIIGGLVIRMGDRMLDRSVNGLLQQMREHIYA